MAIRNNLDDIVNVDIEISTPGSSDESFNNVLLVVEGPVVGKENLRTMAFQQNHRHTLWRMWHFHNHQSQVLFMLLRDRL